MTHSRHSARAVRFIKAVLFMAVLTLMVSACSDSTKTVYTTSPVMPGAFLATVGVDYYNGDGEVLTYSYDNYPVWIMQQGDAVGYFGALGVAHRDRVVFDSKIDFLPDPFVTGLYYSYEYVGSVTPENGAVIMVLTTYYSGNGEKLAGPRRMVIKIFNLVGPVTLPAEDTASTNLVSDTDPERPPFRDLSIAGMRAFTASRAPDID